MNLMSMVRSELRSVFHRKRIVVLVVISFLLIPAFLMEQSSIPPTENNTYYLGKYAQSPPPSCQDYVEQTTYMLLNHNLEILRNRDVSINLLIDYCNRSVGNTNLGQLNDVSAVAYRTTTSSAGNISLNESYVFGILVRFIDQYSVSQAAYIKNYTLTCYNVTSFHVDKQTSTANSGTNYPENGQAGPANATSSGQKGNQTDIIFRFKNSGFYVGNEQICFNLALLPSPQLGYAGVTPLFYVYNNRSFNIDINITSTFSSNLTSGLHSPGNTDQYTIRTNSIFFVNSSNTLLRINGQKMLFIHFKEVNLNATITGNHTISGTKTGLFANYLDYGAGLFVLYSLTIVFLLFSVIFDRKIYMKYLSLPAKRDRIILSRLISTFMVSILFTIGVFLAIDLAAIIMKFPLLDFTSFLYGLIIVTASTFTISSIYSLIGAYRIGRPSYRILSAIGLSAITLVIGTIANIYIELPNSNSSIYNVFSAQSLFSLRLYGFFSSFIPILNIENLNNYLLGRPVFNIVMLNHLSLLDLFPGVLIASILVEPAVLLYLSLRRFKAD